MHPPLYDRHSEVDMNPPLGAPKGKEREDDYANSHA